MLNTSIAASTLTASTYPAAHTSGDTDIATLSSSFNSVASFVAKMTPLTSVSWEKSLPFIDTEKSAVTVDPIPSADWNYSYADHLDAFLQRKNDEFTHLVFPAIVYLAVLGLLGVIGNLMVLYVYNQKLCKGTIRWFVQALAVFDLLSCLVAIPGEIIDMRNNYTFGLSPMCKVLRTVNMFCTMASGMTLMVVAVERYKRICTPLRKHMTPKGAQVVITVCTVAASICAAPASIIYGRQTTPTDHPAINGSDCSTADTLLGSMVPLAFSSFQFLLFLGGAIALVVLYSLIGRKVLNHARFRRDGFGVGANRRMSFIFTGSECSSPTTEDTVFSFPNRRGNDSVEETSSANNNDASSNEVSDNNNVKKRKRAPFTRETQSPPFGECASPVSNVRDSPTSTGSSTSPSSDKATELSPLSTKCLKYEPYLTENAKLYQCNSAEGDLQASSQKITLDTQDAKRSARESSLSETFNTFCNNGIIPEHDVTGYNEDKPLKQIREYEKPSSDASEENSDDYLDRQLPDVRVTGERPVLNVVELAGINTPKRNTSHRNEGSAPDQHVPAHDEGTKSSEGDEQSNDARTCPRPDGKVAAKDPQVGTVPVYDKPSNDGSEELSEVASERADTPVSVSTPPVIPEMEFRRFTRRSVSRQHSSEPPTPTGDLPKAFDTFRRNKAAAASGKASLRDRHRSGDSTGTNLPGRYQRRTSQCRQSDPRRLKRTDSLRSGTRRTTLMLFLISLVYLLSFLPYLVLMIMKVLDKESLSGRGGSWEVAHNVLLRSYFINSMANPIIYSFCSRTFRKECSRAIHCRCCRRPLFVK